MHPSSYYHRQRSRFTPVNPRLVLIAESPPISGKYFYDTNGKPSEPLFKAVMSDILKIEPPTKEAGLVALRDAGIVLLDATYTPLNDGRSDREKREIIRQDFPGLLKLLQATTKRKTTPILIIKSNVYREIGSRLEELDYNVINQRFAVPFPSNGHQGCFEAIVHFLLRDAGFGDQ